MLNYVFIINVLYQNFVVRCNQRELQHRYSYIILKTNGTGNISIFSKSYDLEYPNYIQIIHENFEFSRIIIF